MSRPSLAYSIIITDPTGNEYRWGIGARNPEDVPLSVRYSTATGIGCDTASLTLTRLLDVDYPDLQIEHMLQICDASGDVLWEGYTDTIPRERTVDGDSISVQARGWMYHAARKLFAELLIDQDVQRWGEMPRWRRASLISGGWGPFVSPDSHDDGWVYLQIPEMHQASNIGLVAETHYVAPSPIGEVIARDFSGVLAGAWLAELRTTDVDSAAGQQTTQVAGVASPQTISCMGNGSSRRAYVLWRYNAAHDGVGPWHAEFRPIVYGDHDITRRTRSDGGPDGLYVTDMLRFLWGKHYPQADLSGVVDTDYPVPHAAWHELTNLQATTADLNKYHGYMFGMWPGKQLEFRPFDFSTADWQVAPGESGVEIRAAGDSSEAVYNGATGTYTDFGGQTHILTPDDVPDLRDESPWIPSNQWGTEAWYEVPPISSPCDEVVAVQIMRQALADANRAKRPSVITVPYEIQTGAGDWEPVGKVRAGQTIPVTNLESDEPRLITSTEVQDDRLTISTDDATADLQSILAERIDVQRMVKGLA